MAEPDGVDGRHKAGHDGGGRPSTVIAISARLYLDKIRNTPYTLLLTEYLPARRRPAPGEERLCCLKTDLTTTRRASRRERNVFLLHRPQPIEKSRFEKISASKR
jgi:hypothetical protein